MKAKKWRHLCSETILKRTACSNLAKRNLFHYRIQARSYQIRICIWDFASNFSKSYYIDISVKLPGIVHDLRKLYDICYCLLLLPPFSVKLVKLSFLLSTVTTKQYPTVILIFPFKNRKISYKAITFSYFFYPTQKYVCCINYLFCHFGLFFVWFFWEFIPKLNYPQCFF